MSFGSSSSSTDRPGDAEAARSEALKRVARRPLTEREIRSRLEARGFELEAIDEAIERLEEAGLIDDRSLALDYIVARANRLGHGRSRLIRELERRGVGGDLARRAWDDAIDSGDLDPVAILQRESLKHVERAGGRLETRDYRRVYNALLRGGHEAGAVVATLRPYRDHPDSEEG